MKVVELIAGAAVIRAIFHSPQGKEGRIVVRLARACVRFRTSSISAVGAHAPKGTPIEEHLRFHCRSRRVLGAPGGM